MNALTSYVSYISGYIPATVKDAAGLNPQISQDVRHIAWLSVERVFWPPQESLRIFLALGYSDGFQIWDLQDPTAATEVVSKQDKPVTNVRLLPIPLVTGDSADGGRNALGVTAAPLAAYLHRGAPALVRLFSLQAHDDVHLLRLTEPARSLQTSRRYFAVGLARQVDLYDALHFQQLFSVQCAAAAASPTFALGHRWLAYNLPPQQTYAPGFGPANLLSGGARQLPSLMRDGVQYLGQMSQKTFDAVLMPPPDGSEQPGIQSASRCGIIAVRDAASRAVIAQFEDHTEAIDMMAWDPSGLQLVSCAAQGHQILVHRALLGAEQALMTHDSEDGGLAVGSVVFQHLFTLNRGYTPAVISDITVSDDGQCVAVCSAKGTTHVFRLPPLHAAALGHHSPETGDVRLTSKTACSSQPADMSIGLRLGSGSSAPKALNINASVRVKLGSSLLREGLMPKCGFLTQTLPTTSSRASTSQSRNMYPRMYIATRAGSLSLYSLFPPPAHPSSGTCGGNTGSHASGAVGAKPAGATGENNEWQALLAREVHFCRQLRHFTERRLSPSHIAVPANRGRAASASRSLADVPPSAKASDAGVAQTNLVSAWSSPKLRPQSSPSLGPRPSPLSSPRTATKEEPSNLDVDAQKWLSQVETATHVPVEVPLWIRPQLSFYTYPSDASVEDINSAVREGAPLQGRQQLEISRPEPVCDGIRYDGEEESLSQLIEGALDTTVDDPVSTRARRNSPAMRRSGAASGVGSGPAGSPKVALAPAWGTLGGIEEPESACSQEQAGASGGGLQDVEENWLQS